MDIQLRPVAGANPEIRIAKLSKPQRTIEVAARLQHMQKMIGAKDYAVFRLVGQGLPSTRRLTCALSNWADQEECRTQALLETHGEGLMAHLEVSTLPVVWGGEARPIATLVLPPFTKLFTSQHLAFSGIAFPVRLGSNGSGFVVFTGELLDIGSEILLDVHMRANQVMIDLLGADEKKMQPAEALNEREIACLQMAGDGCISETIAEKMGLSVHTVNAYLGTATAKLDAVNRIQAIAKAIRLGYIR